MAEQIIAEELKRRRWQEAKSLSVPKRRRFATPLASLDDGLGAVREKLRSAGLEENTLVVFFSDNGGPTRDNTRRNDPLRGFKALSLPTSRAGIFESVLSCKLLIVLMLARLGGLEGENHYFRR